MEYWKYTGLASLLCITTLSSQNLKGDFTDATEQNQVVIYTLVERFEPDLALTASKREEMKEHRFAEIKTKMQMLDTMDISDRRRDKLLEALMADPLSPKLDKVFAETEFEEHN